MYSKLLNRSRSFVEALSCVDIMTYQAWQITSPGNLTLVNLSPIPQPSRKQVLIRIHAAAFNYREILVIDHNPDYPVNAKADLIPAADGAGEVEAAGPGSVWRKGDRVVIHPNSWMTGSDCQDYRLEETMGGGEWDGTLTQYLVLDDSRVFRAPAGLTHIEASTLFTAGATAYNGLFYDEPKVGPGVTVLTQGTGGVSCYAIMVRRYTYRRGSQR